jgi:hypothetical protein
MTRDEWLAALAAELDVAAPSADMVDALLDVASTAAHASERQAAPLSCWLVGVAGVDPARALEIARRLAPSE